MTEQTFIREISSALSVLSSKQRDQLGRMLHDSGRRRAFQQLIESALKLSNGIGSSNAASGETRNQSDTAIPAAEGYDEDSVRQSFASVLCDKKTFRTTLDLIHAVRYFFNTEIDARRFVKAGRRETIAEAWRQVCALPARERSERLRRFFQKFAGLLDPHRSYRELFRMLSRSE
jgi:hypothetical protein